MHATRLFALLVVVLACKPVMMDVWWPGRLASDSMRAPAARIDAVVPEGEPVFVLGKQEFPDVAFYSRRAFHWIDYKKIDAGSMTRSRRAFFLMRDDEINKNGTLSASAGFTEALTFMRTGRKVVLFTLEVSPGT